MQSSQNVARGKRADSGRVSERYQALVKHARSGRVFDLQHGHDGRHHRHDLSPDCSIASEYISKSIPKLGKTSLPVIARKSGYDVLKSAHHRLNALHQFIVLKNLSILHCELS